MPRLTFRSTLIALTIALWGCQTGLPTRINRTAPVQLGSASPATVLAGIQDPLRVIGTNVVSVDLIGKVKLLSDKGLGIISNNGGALISDKGLGVISNNGGSLAGTSALLASTRTLLQTAAPQESLLANATIEVLDGAGNLLVDAQKHPITTTSDQTGQYHFNAQLPAENLWLRVKLYNGGQLEALLPKSAPSSMDIDTAATLGAAYVLQQYVQGNATVYQRLPAADAATLQSQMEAAAASITKAPSYKVADSVAAAGSLKANDPQLSATLEHIKAELLLGQTNLGAGLPAVNVPLVVPLNAYRDAAGDTFVAEGIGRIRKIDAQGNISLYAGLGPSGTVIGTLSFLSDMIGAPDGTLYVAESKSQDIQKITPSGTMTRIVGGGTAAPDGAAGPSAKIGGPSVLALGKGGVLYIGEASTYVDNAGPRIFKLDTSGTLHTLPTLPVDPTSQGAARPFALAEAADGTVYAGVEWSWIGGASPPAILSLAPGGTSWTTVYTGPGLAGSERLVGLADGSFYLTAANSGAVLKLTTDPSGSGKLVATTVAGGGAQPIQDGQVSTQGAFNGPSGLWVGQDGSMLVVDTSDCSLWQVDAKGIATHYAGAQGLTQVGNTLGLAINTPGAAVVDPNGNLVFSEGGSNTIKRLVGKTVQLVAGGTVGDRDGVGAQARFNGPGALAYFGSDLYVADVNNFQIRKIAADGTVTTLAGKGYGMSGGIADQTPAKQATIGEIGGLAVDAQGRPVFSDLRNNEIFRLEPTGTLTVLAGSITGDKGDSGDGGPANKAVLSAPSGLAYDKQGNLYVVDSGNLCVRKIDTQGNISLVAGTPLTQALLRLVGGQIDQGPVAAASALFVGPVGICLDAQGDIYLSELGSQILSLGQAFALGGTSIPFQLPNTPARIRKIAPDGTVSIVAGPGSQVLSDTAGDNSMTAPSWLTIDAQGRLVVVDLVADQIKVIPQGAF